MILQDISTKELVNALFNRQGVRSMNVSENEYCRIRAAGANQERERYINVGGEAVILIISSEDN